MKELEESVFEVAGTTIEVVFVFVDGLVVGVDVGVLTGVVVVLVGVVVVVVVVDGGVVVGVVVEPEELVVPVYAAYAVGPPLEDVEGVVLTYFPLLTAAITAVVSYCS